MNQFIRTSLCTLVLGLLLLRVNAAEKPNILFILVDDMGWSDIGCYGGEIETPHIDSLAAQGVRFTQFYNTAKCMTSRGCLLTGAKYPETYQNKPLTPMQGVSLLPSLEGKPLARKKPIYWQWTASGAISIGKMKAVFWGRKNQWGLYNLSKDNNESHDLAQSMPEMLGSMKKQWKEWRISTQPNSTKR